MEKQIIMYSADYCTNCKIIKMYLDAKEIPYELRDISNDTYKEELTSKNLMSIPVLVINGEYHVVNTNNFIKYL